MTVMSNEHSQVLVSSIKAAATPSGWLYKPETLSEISVTTEQFCVAC
jgi:hypothetical protein